MNPSTTKAAAPTHVYTERLEACRKEARRLRTQHLRFGHLRLAWAAMLLAIAWFAFGRHDVRWEWLVLPWLGFAVTGHFHARAMAAGARAKRAVDWNEHGLARIEDRWAGLKPRSAAVDVSKSLFAVDLDLFGAASLFELLCTARTSLGEQTLAAWLLAPALREEILARQAAVADLRDRAGLRENMASAEGPDVVAVDREALVHWGEANNAALPPWVQWAAPALMLATLACALRWALGGSPVALVALIAVDTLVTYTVQRRLDELMGEAKKAAKRFRTLSDLFGHVERERFNAPRLHELQTRLLGSRVPASRALRRAAQLSRANFMRNGLLRAIDIPLLYSVQLGGFVQRWHGEHGPSLAVWMSTLGEFEALLSLSAYHFEHPDDLFPELAAEGLVYHSTGLGHPLLPQTKCVRNDVALDGDTRLLLVSGSNMSGKSTLLRAVGINAVLAMAGAPVRARQLRLSPFHLGASIQINDSLQSGRSRFYAEILRLRAICDLCRTQPPGLFLLDELLAGTNSHDRLEGAVGLVRQLLAFGAVGLLSTHDLALTGIAEGVAQHIRNVHFEDQISDDHLVFDYTLRPGVVTRSNGLALMRLIGLDV